MNEPTYRKPFFAALSVCILLAAGLAYVTLHRNHSVPVQNPADPVVAQGPAVSSQPAASADPLRSSSDPELAPLQLSPQRLQEIGVTTAVVQRKDVNDHLQVPGNVDIDEERLAYVQTRFPGWIQNVYANATWQYVRKGQPLFTIYSPDLVSTEQEYLLAKQN
ncbi:MAG: efflux RND transporter periplasmic adaptor subunit, partial [Acidobacteriaceae bacterium]